MALAWKPEVYARHGSHRLRPALDLLARVPLDRAEAVVDLGCGAGALFPALRARFPKARLTGVDLSPAMLAEAGRSDPDVELIVADAGTWRPRARVDLIFANASLHWVPRHERLLPALLRCCRVLAIQLPDNFAAPAHRLIREVMGEVPWAERLAAVQMGDHVQPPATYMALLKGAGAGVDMWQTTYYQLLIGPDSVLEWLRGTALLPVQAALGGAAALATREFEEELGRRLRVAYPIDAAGEVLFPFRRLFLVATGGAA
jgi:trans-aconitate 2-methyltransferase